MTHLASLAVNLSLYLLFGPAVLGYVCIASSILSVIIIGVFGDGKGEGK